MYVEKDAAQVAQAAQAADERCGTERGERH